MIDDVRKTVLTALNKENRGYLTPEQFNLYAKQAQMNIFNLYFTEHSRLVAMKNARRLSSEYANMIDDLRDKLDRFTSLSNLYPKGYDIDTPANSTTAINTFTPPSDIVAPISFRYNGYPMEKVSKAREILLSRSNHTAPSTEYPIYSEVGGKYTVSPFVAQDALLQDVWYPIEAIYIRTPKDPAWTYSSISGSEEPIFNPSALDYQDFELPAEDAPKLVLEILKLAGVTIRDAEVVQAANGLDTTQYQKENS